MIPIFWKILFLKKASILFTFLCDLNLCSAVTLLRQIVGNFSAARANLADRIKQVAVKIASICPEAQRVTAQSFIRYDSDAASFTRTRHVPLITLLAVGFSVANLRYCENHNIGESRSKIRLSEAQLMVNRKTKKQTQRRPSVGNDWSCLRSLLLWLAELFRQFENLFL